MPSLSYVQRRHLFKKKKKNGKKLTFLERPDRLSEPSRPLESREEKRVFSSSALRMRGRRRKKLRRRAAQEERGHVVFYFDVSEGNEGASSLFFHSLLFAFALFSLLSETWKKKEMRGLLSAARRTGVLGKPNASPAPIAPSNLLPCRRVPSPGLRCPTASLREARKTAAAASAADRLHHHRRRRLPSSRATAPSSAASPAPAAPGDESQGKIESN